MGTHRDQSVRNTCKIVAGMLALGLGVPASAAANHRELPAVFTSIASIELDERTAAIEHASDLLALDSEASKSSVRVRARLRNFKLLKYSRSLAVGKEDVILQFQTPGKRKSIMTFELKF